MRILIVEDEIKIRTGLSRLISSHTSHTVIGEAKNGKEGLEAAMRLRPDLIISDIRMPLMDGLEMVEQLRTEEIPAHIVILSGYSEFDYARKALRFGVDDYLLKPLAPEDVTGLLDKIQKVLKEEKRRSVETTEGILRDLLLGGKRVEAGDLEKLKTLGGFTEDGPLYLAAGYMGDTNPRYSAALVQKWESMKRQYPDDRIYYTILENTQEMFCLFQTGISFEQLKEKLKRRVYLDAGKEDRPVWAMTLLTSFIHLNEGAEALRELYPYGMRLGYREILTSQQISQVVSSEFRYPKEMEGRFQTCICAGAGEKLLKEGGIFKEYVRNSNCKPSDYRRAYQKMVSFVENVCHEMGAEKPLQEQDYGKIISQAVTAGELEQCFDQLIHTAAAFGDKKEDIRNYTISRAIAYIREHFGDNISLEMTANHLDITPEYLSTLFNKEMGINFSTFLKRFRISQAKRLIKGTDKRIYEIAAEVGYHDPKYFNRVFKEEIGVSPGDYRQL